jgi:hypothetical protein
LDEKTYKIKVNSVTLARIFSFFVWKFFVGLIFYSLFLRCIKNFAPYLLPKYIYEDLQTNFNITLFLGFYTFSIVAVYLMFNIFQMYEELGSKKEMFINAILEPGEYTIFSFLNTAIIFLMSKNLQYALVKRKPTFSYNNYLHISYS